MTKVVYTHGDGQEYMHLTNQKNTKRNRDFIEMEFRIWWGKHQQSHDENGNFIPAEIVRIEG